MASDTHERLDDGDGESKNDPLDPLKKQIFASLLAQNSQFYERVNVSNLNEKISYRVKPDIHYQPDFTCFLRMFVLVDRQVEEQGESYGAYIRTTTEVSRIDEPAIMAALKNVLWANRRALVEMLAGHAAQFLYPHLELQGKFPDIPKLKEGMRQMYHRIMNPA